MTSICIFFFFNDTATTEIYTLSLHDALPISWIWRPGRMRFEYDPPEPLLLVASHGQFLLYDRELRQPTTRSEEHTSELQSRQYLVCRLLLEKKKKKTLYYIHTSSTPTLYYIF